MFGEANGTATGMAHHAHLAMYKVSEFECAEGYVLAAMDVVVEDGVDVLSLSVGCPIIPLYEDVIASCIWSNSKGSFSWLESVDNSTLPSPKPTFNIISGHVNTSKANGLGLNHDLQPEDCIHTCVA
ncbi:hypothetical protein ACFX2I_032135 [Malus domestica]